LFPLHAIFYTGKKIYLETAKIAVLGDMHLDKVNSSQTTQQKREVLSWLKATNACCIMEDKVSLWKDVNYIPGLNLYKKIKAATPGSFNIVGCSSSLSSTLLLKSPLINLCRSCQKKEINALNCEWRIAVSDNKKDLTDINKILFVLQASPLRNNLTFNQSLAEILNVMPKINHKLNYNLSQQTENDEQFLHTIRSRLLALYTVHLLHGEMNKNSYHTFVICVGAEHLEEIAFLIDSIWHIKNTDENFCQPSLYSKGKPSDKNIKFALDNALNIKEFFDKF
jgi:hypothetical protein